MQEKKRNTQGVFQFIAATIAIVIIGCASIFPIVAAADFSVASIRGTYASTGSDKGPRGASGSLGLFTFDGKGNVSGVIQINQPDGKTKDGRVLFEFKNIKGKYWVGSGGRGVVKGLSDSTELDDIFVITKSDKKGIATDLFMILGDVGPASGGVRASHMTRQHDGARSSFSKSSIRGSYALTGMFDGPDSAAASIGVFKFDGKGTVSIISSINRPDGKGTGGRELLTRKGIGKYWVGAGGRGSFSGVSGSRGTPDLFVITESDSKGLATELFVIFGDLSGRIDALVTFKLTRQHQD